MRRLCGDFAAKNGREADDVFWSLLDYHRQYILRLARAIELLARGERNRAAGAWREMRDFICENEPEYQPYLDVYRVLEVTEKFTGFPVNEKQTKSMDGFPANAGQDTNERK